MAKNRKPLFVGNGGFDGGVVTLTAANTTKDGTSGTVPQLYEAGPDGGVVVDD